MQISQPRLQSLIESLVNIAIGFLIAYSAQLVIFPMYGIEITHSAHLQITGLFTVVSVARSYCLRRAFNWLHVRMQTRRAINGGMMSRTVVRSLLLALALFCFTSNGHAARNDLDLFFIGTVSDSASPAVKRTKREIKAKARPNKSIQAWSKKGQPSPRSERLQAQLQPTVPIPAALPPSHPPVEIPAPAVTPAGDLPAKREEIKNGPSWVAVLGSAGFGAMIIVLAYAAYRLIGRIGAASAGKDGA